MNWRGRRPLVVVAVLGLVAPAGCSDDNPPPAPKPDVLASVVTVPPIEPAPLPTARTEVAGTAWEGRIVVVGGLTEAGVASDRVDVYDPVTNRWEAGPPLPIGLHHVGLATLGGRMYVAGGYHNPTPAAPWEPQSRVISLGSRDTVWREEPPLAGPRGGLAMAALSDRLVAFGGTGPEGVLRRTEVLAPGDGGWRPGPDLTEPRDHLAAASSGGRVFAIAGRQGSLDSNLATVESWDGRPGGWQAESSLDDPRGGTSASGGAGGRVCVAGGEEPEGTITSVECRVNGRWQPVATLRIPRHGLAVVGVERTLHVIGGGPQPGLFVSTAHEVFDVP